MKYLFNVKILLFSCLFYSFSAFSLSENDFPYNTIGRVGHCSATLLSERVALVSAHCLLQLSKDLKPDAYQFIIKGQSIDIQLAVLGTSDFALDSFRNPLVMKDWAFIILKENKYTKERMYLNLINKHFSSYDINRKEKELKNIVLESIGLDEDLRMIVEPCRVYNEKNSDIIYTTSRGQVGGYSGVLVDQNFNITALMSISAGYYSHDPLPSTAIKNIAIPVTDTMIKTYEIVDYLVKIKPTISVKDLYQTLSEVNYMVHDTNSSLIVVGINYDPEKNERTAILQPVKSLNLIDKLKDRRIKEEPRDSFLPLNNQQPKRPRIFRRIG